MKKIILVLIILESTNKNYAQMELNKEVYDSLLAYTIKAPSGHNTQPWKITFTKNIIEISPDFSKKLLVVDPNYRELYISLGCATENLIVAASKFGFDAKYQIIQKNDTSFIIQITLEKSINPQIDKLFEYIKIRQTNRSIYDSTIISETEILKLKELENGKGVNFHFYQKTEESFKIIEQYIEKGNNIQMSNKAFKQELIHWIRFNKKQIKKTNDGLTYQTLNIPSMPKWLGKIAASIKMNPKAQNKADRIKINSSSHLVLFTTKNSSFFEWIELGICLEKFLLTTTSLGISNAYMNQPCEIRSLSESLSDELKLVNEYPEIILRIGYGKLQPYSPRRELKSR